MNNVTKDKELIKMAEQLADARKTMKEAIEKEEDIKSRFKIIMKKKKIKVLIAGGYALMIKTGRNTVTDWDKIKELLGERFKEFQKKGKLQTKLYIEPVK